MQIYSEITPLQEQDVFVLLDSINNGFEYPIHSHPEFEINLVLGANGTRIVGDSVEPYHNNDLVLIGPYLLHKWDVETIEGVATNPIRVITIQFRKDTFSSSFFRKNQFINIQKLLSEVSRGIRFFGETFDEASKIMIEMTTINGFLNITKFLQLLELLANSEHKEFLSSEGFNPHAVILGGDRVQITMNYILKHFKRNDLKIEELAVHLNMSLSAFSHFFKKYTNKSFKKYLIDVRLGHACKLLIDTEQNIKQICSDSGFNNVSNFNRLFRKYRRCTPIEFRQRSKKGISFDWTKQITPGQFMPVKSGMREPFQPATYTTTKVMHV